MDYFAGLDISMDESHVCVLDREGEVIYEGKTASTAQAIAVELAKAPSCGRIVFETGPNGPDLVPRAQPARPSRGLCRSLPAMLAPDNLPGADIINRLRIEWRQVQLAASLANIVINLSADQEFVWLENRPSVCAGYVHFGRSRADWRCRSDRRSP
jgi:hypothetical protein